MTHVSTYPGGRSRSTRSMVGALVLTVGVAAALATGFAISQQNDTPTSPQVTSSDLARKSAETARLQGMADAWAKQAQEAGALKEAIAKGLVPGQTLEPAQTKSAQEAEALKEAIAKGLVPEQTLEPTQSKSAQEAEALRDAINKGFVPEQAQSPAYAEQLGQPR